VNFRSQVSVVRSQDSVAGSVSSRRFVALLLLMMVIGAGAALYLAPGLHRVAATSQTGSQKSVSTVSLPLFFEPNLGQTDSQVKFLARGTGYGLFLTANEAVLELRHSAVSSQHSSQLSAVSSQHAPGSVIRMKLEGANSSARLVGAAPLPGTSNYFIGNDPSKWRQDIPLFARVEYQAVYPGVDLVYYGDQGRLEYDFRVAPAADPNQIALHFDGASAHIDSGDLILSTDQGDVRFHAPRIYQQDGNAQREISGSFRQIAQNRIGFTVGAYDRSRELVIDPILSYSTYLGGSLDESHVHVAIGQDGNIYLAGATTSTDFPLSASPFQAKNNGVQNVFIAVLNPNLSGGAQLVYVTYLGGSGIDYPEGVAVSSNTDTGQGYDVYVAGTTTSTDFPTASVNTPFQATIPSTAPLGASHGFVTRLNWATNSLRYSTYLAGSNGADAVTGLAIDFVGDAFVTGTTTSTNDVSHGAGFPSNANGLQTVSYAPNQFFASKINTKGSGSLSMLYSTYFGGDTAAVGTGRTLGGGIAVDASGNMYITGGTDFLGPQAVAHSFPLVNAQQTCLDQASKTNSCANNPAPSGLDAFAAKINPNIAGSPPVFSTYLGGAGDDVGYGIAVDSAGSTYVTGSTTSAGATGWVAPTSITPFQTDNGGGTDAFIAKIGNPGAGTSFPLTYFTYLGGSGTDIGTAIVVDANQAAHVAGTTNSADTGFPFNPLPGQVCAVNGANDAMVALISTTLSGRPTLPNTGGEYLTCLGGSADDQGLGIALDPTNSTYVSGITISTNFPTVNPFQPNLDQLNGSHYDAFVSKLGASSNLALTFPTTSPSPNPVAAGNQVAFTFDITNKGPDTATNVIFTATFPATGVGSQAAKVTSGNGSCGGLVGQNTITCTIASLSVGALGVVELDLTPTIPVVNPQVTGVSGTVTANGNGNPKTVNQPAANITDFSIGATAPAVITAGQTTSTIITLAPSALTPNPTYSGSITVSDTGLPTGAAGTFDKVMPITLSGSGSETTTLSISTQARPVTTGSLLRGHPFYAAWLPVGGLSLLGLGVAGRKRRRWLAGALLGLVAGILLLQAACGSSSSPNTNTGTPAGTYVITITGSSGTVSHNTTVQLIVN